MFSQLFQHLDINSDLVYYALVNFGSDLLTARIAQSLNAITFLKAAIEKDPSGPIPWLNLSIAYAYTKNWKEALVCIRELKNMVPEHSIMRYVEKAEAAYKEENMEKVLEIPVIAFHSEQQKIVTQELQHKKHVALTLD